MERKFKVGDRVIRDSDGHKGTVTWIDFYRPADPNAPYWVRVKWDASGSRSDREENGLSLISENT